MSKLVIIACILLSFTALAAEKAAQVQMMRGTVNATVSGATTSLKKGDWVNEKTKISTGEKSFVKIVLSDKSQVTLGPKSSMVVQRGSKAGKQGLISLIGGQLRAKVDKKQGAVAKNKLLIRTKNAAMGVRGTDFEISFNPANGLSNVLAYSGEVRSVILPKGGAKSVQDINNAVNMKKSVSVRKGQYSAINSSYKKPLNPIRISPTQFFALRRNKTFDATTERAPSQSRGSFRSPIPRGANASAFMNRSSSVGNQIKSRIGSSAFQGAKNTVSAAKAQYRSSAGGSKIKEGGYYHPRVGYIIPPANSPIDPNTGLAIPPPETGGVGEDGNYVPPKGSVVTLDGQVIADPNAANSSSKDDETKPEIETICNGPKCEEAEPEPEPAPPPLLTGGGGGCPQDPLACLSFVPEPPHKDNNNTSATVNFNITLQ
ncbi:MAG: FecR domain-containing protein [Bacteriovoracaceae bacterium]|nr:FecR domain-containing protein [Bacteriovoracaceae bacterium]